MFSPLKIGGVTLKNRIISAPMTYPILTSDGCLTPEAIAFYELRAKGGAAVVTVSEVIVDSKTGKYYPIQVVLDAPNAKDSLAMAARAIRRHGAVPSLELSHGGKYALTEGLPMGPSDDYENGKKTARAMTKDDIGMLIEAYGRAAKTAKDAGFGMLLVHAGHGWLLQQFFSPATNKRTDEYGGSLKNRARFALEVLDEIRSAVGPGFPLELRVSASEYTEDGYPFEDIVEFAGLVQDKVDIIQVSTGAHHGSFDKTHPPCSWSAASTSVSPKKSKARQNPRLDHRRAERAADAGRHYRFRPRRRRSHGAGASGRPVFTEESVYEQGRRDRPLLPLLYLHGRAPYDGA